MATPFSLVDLKGQSLRLEELRGKKVMLNFWATWCGPCRAEVPLMIRIYDEYRSQGLEILAINLRENPTQVARFAREYAMPFPVLLDDQGEVATAYFVRAIPTSVFLDEHGIIRAVHIGTLTERTLRQYIGQLVK